MKPLLTAICLLGAASVSHAATASKPNIVFILADDLGYMGNSDVTDDAVDSLRKLTGLKEPNVDRTGISEEGMARLRKALPAVR